jgi:hypothetical protein
MGILFNHVSLFPPFHGDNMNGLRAVGDENQRCSVLGASMLVFCMSGSPAERPFSLVEKTNAKMRKLREIILVKRPSEVSYSQPTKLLILWSRLILDQLQNIRKQKKTSCFRILRQTDSCLTIEVCRLFFDVLFL